MRSRPATGSASIWGPLREVSEVTILQGRNSTDDVDCFDHARLEYSADGRTWHPLLDDLRRQYVIEWRGEPVGARYVRLLRLDSPRTNWAAVRSFEVNPVRAERLGFRVEAADAERALYAFDRDPGTSFRSDGRLAFEVPDGVREYVLLLDLPGEDGLRVRQLAADGSVLSETAVGEPFFRLALADGAASVALRRSGRGFRDHRPVSLCLPERKPPRSVVASGRVFFVPGPAGRRDFACVGAPTAGMRRLGR